jgi:hypothetical protein
MIGKSIKFQFATQPTIKIQKQNSKHPTLLSIELQTNYEPQIIFQFKKLIKKINN